MEKAAGVFFPCREEIEALKVGDMAPNAFGKMAEVVEISFRGVDVNGRAYVGYYTKSSETSSMSASMKEGCVVRHSGMRKTSAEIDAMEREFRAGGC